MQSSQDVLHLIILCAGVAQSVEQLIRNQQVECSNHFSSTKQIRTNAFGFFVALTQTIAFVEVSITKRFPIGLLIITTDEP